MFHSGLPSPSVYPFKEMTENESECAGIKHLNSLLPGHYRTVIFYTFPSPTLFCWFDFIYISSLCIRSLFYWTGYSTVTKQNSRVGWNHSFDLKIRFHYLNLHLIPQHCLNWRWAFSYVIIIIYMQWFLKVVKITWKCH